MSEERESLEELIAEAHRCIKDMRQMLTEARIVRDEIQAVIHGMIDADFSAIIAEETTKYLAEYGKALDEAITQGENAVYKRFDDITRILLNETKTAKRRGETVEDQVRAVIEQRGWTGE